MDTRTRKIFSTQMMAAICGATIPPEELAHFREMKLSPTLKQMARRPPRVGRNEPCPCGSGKKFKRCCYAGPAMPNRRKGRE